MLSEADIAAMRSVAGAALPGTAIIQRKSFSDDGGGGGTVSWTAAGTVDCRLALLSGSEREIADRIADDAESIVTLPAETTITTKDRMQISGRTYNVLALHERDDWEITRRVEVCEEV